MALLTLEEAKQQLNISGSGQDVELQAYVDSITAVVERFVGPVEDREVSEVVEGGQVVCLRRTPVTALTAFTPLLDGGAPVDVAGLVVDGSTGLVRRADGGRLTGGPWRVTYTAGRGEVPPTINLAARMLLQHLWRTQNGTRAAVFGGDGDGGDPVPGFGFAVPNRVLQLLEPYRLPPEVA